MGVTRLKRKDRKNKARANNRVAKIKQLLSTPVIKNVDVDELKASFNQGGTKNQGAETKGEETKGEETKGGKVKEERNGKTAPAAPEAAPPVAPPASEDTEVPVGTPSKEEVFTAEETAAAEQAAAEADALEPGDVESPGEQFVRNQLADTTTNAQDKDIDAINKVEGDETDITPKA